MSVLSLNIIFLQSLLVTFWKAEIVVPWNEDLAVAEDGIWSILSIAVIVNSPCFNCGGHTNTSPLYFVQGYWVRSYWLSLTHW